MSPVTPRGVRARTRAEGRGFGCGVRLDFAGASDSMPSATAAMAYPGYARARKKLENNARRAGKPGTAPIMRAFSFLVRVVLAAVLLPLDLLVGEAMRTGDMTRPLTGAFGVAVAYGAFRAAEFAVGLGRAAARETGDESVVARRTRFRVRPPPGLDPCRLRDVPFLSRSSMCAITGTVARTVVEPFRVETTTNARALWDVVDLDDGFATRRALRRDGVARAAVDVSLVDEDVAAFPYAASRIVALVLNWKPALAHGPDRTGVRALLVGGGGGNVAAYVALERACRARARTRHRRAERGEGACEVTLIEKNEALANALRLGFHGMGARSSRGDESDVDGARDSCSRDGRFAVVARDPSSALRDAAPGSLDVIVFDARRDVSEEAIVSEEEVSRSDPTVTVEQRERVKKRASGRDGDDANSVSEFSDASRAVSLYRDARRALRAGGVAVSVAVAPAVGVPGLGGAGGADLAVLADAMRAAFDEETKKSGSSSVRFERVGPFVPGFAQETLAVATKTVDAALAARLNYN